VIFREQAEILAEAGADALHLETMSDLREALLALAAVREAAPGLPVLASLTFERKRRGFFTVMGDALTPSLRQLSEAGACVTGANCTLISRDMADLAREVLSAPGIRLAVQPNAGAPEQVPGGFRYAQEPEEFAADLSGLIQSPSVPVTAAGSRIAALGGCCGTDHRFIASLKQRLERGS
jgi:5-methyltetrahydrofolate--homocysteine methyltransferase